jgi:dCTP deaminase
MILVDWQISKHIQSWITPYNPEQINPASYDICVGDTWRDIEYPKYLHKIPQNGLKIHKNSIFIDLINVYYDQMFKIFNNIKYLNCRKPTAVLVTTKEWLNFPDNIAAEIKLKTTPTREGLGHPIADWIDPGFRGELTMMLYANKTLILKPGRRICQLVLHEVQTPHLPYGMVGHYQGQSGATPSWRLEGE